MNFSITTRRGRRAALALGLALLITLSWPGPASALPDDLQVPSGHKLYLVGHAKGVQVYSCRLTESGYSWASVHPEATLEGQNGKFLTSHYAGPTWEARDGSKVAARRLKDAPSPISGAIPWLLLESVSTSAGPDGGERLVHTTYIQRINTTGGAAPATACDAFSVGDVASVAYTADYHFFKATGAGAG